MRVLLMISAVALSTLAPAAALACGDEGAQRPVDPSVFAVQQSTNVLLVRAERIERTADSVDEQARHSERRAAELTARAREAKLVAFEMDGVERSNLLIAAGELGLRANQEKKRAQRAHAQARNLRAQARQLRVRAASLTGVPQIPMRRI